MNLSKFYIDGDWVNPIEPNSIPVINPASEESIGNVSIGSKEDVDKAVQAARNAFQSFSKTLVSERVELLTEIRNIYKKRFDDIATAIQTEMGAPNTLARGSQATVGLSHLKTAIRVLENHKFEFKHGSYIVRHEPIGVCGLITPWNWPINQVVSKLAPCLASGCTAVLKPSEIAPLSSMVIAEIFHEAGVPKGVLNLVNGLGPVVGEAMSNHVGIDMMSFTGSTRGGIAVARASANSVKRVCQELGGKSPNIILDDENFKISVSDGVKSCMSNTGQSCNAPTRMLVPKKRYDEALEIAIEANNKIVTGDPGSDKTDIGPLVSETQYTKVQKLIQSGIDNGANLISGGLGKPQGLETGYYVKPTIFGGVSNDMEIAREEIFGPVLCIITYKDFEDAIDIANDTEYGLAAYVSGADPNELMKYARELNAGQIHLNYGSAGSDAPFGGYKQSGNGREKAEWGLEEYLEVKAIMGK
ncbi:aldehyde dehydrogenase family protein [SAR116 cluster bacterium]|nr:aldehyde dehydrogenase family protein [SAR116 cluster bacterium]